MRLQPVPVDQRRLFQVSAQRFKELNVLLLLDRAFMRMEQSLRVDQPSDHGDLHPVEVKLDDRRLHLDRPCVHPRGPLAQAGLVDEDDQLSFVFGIFLSAGQFLCFQACMASGSRSMARRSGFCTENLKQPRMRQIGIWPNVTP